MMRVIFLLLVSSIALQSKSQTWNNYLQKRFKSYGIWADSVLLVPNDTSLNKTGFAIKGSTAYIGDGVKWTAIVDTSIISTKAYVNYKDDIQQGFIDMRKLDADSIAWTGYATRARLYKVSDSISDKLNNKLNASAVSIGAGQVAFGSGTNTIGGDNGLSWDNTNKRLGIGTTAPISKLTINSNGGTDYSLPSPGSGTWNIALGISANTALISGMDFKNFNASGQVRLMARGDDDGYIVINAPGSSSSANILGQTANTAHYLFNAGTGTGLRNLAIGTIGAKDVIFATNNLERMIISSAGSVGIGTTAPTQKLHVVGNGLFTGTVKVGAYTLPSTDGTSNEVLKTDGTGTLYWKPDNGIALTSLSATAPLSYNNTTGVFSISQANTSTNGYLSSTDWNTFNNKQTALGFTPENIANKKTTLSDNSDTYYPTQKAVKTAVDAKQDTITEITKLELDSLITVNGLKTGQFYKISGVHPTLYGGTTIIMQAESTNKLVAQGHGIFYNPKYNESNIFKGIWNQGFMLGTFDSVSGNFDYKNKETVTANNGATGKVYANGFIKWVSGNWSSVSSITGNSSAATADASGFTTPTYSIDSMVVWGGRVYKNKLGNLGNDEGNSPLDNGEWYSLNSSDWEVVGYENENGYTKVIDVIRYDYANDLIIYRADNKGNEVEYNYKDIIDIQDNYNDGINAIQLFQWGRESEAAFGGVYNNKIKVASFADIINNYGSIHSNTLTNSYIYSNTLTNSSIYFNTLTNSYISSNTLTNNSNIYSNTLTNSNIYSNTLTNSSIYSNTLTNSSISSNTLTNSYIHSNTLTNSYIYSNTLTNSSIYFNTLTNYSYISSNTITNNSEIRYNTLTNNSNIYSNTITNNSSIYSNTLTNSSISSNTLTNNSEIRYNTLTNNSEISMGTSNTLSNKNIQYNNFIRGSILNVSLGSATIVFGNFEKTIYKRSDGTTKIRYFNENDVLIISDITD